MNAIGVNNSNNINFKGTVCLRFSPKVRKPRSGFFKLTSSEATDNSVLETLAQLSPKDIRRKIKSKKELVLKSGTHVVLLTKALFVQIKRQQGAFDFASWYVDKNENIAKNFDKARARLRRILRH